MRFCYLTTGFIAVLAFALAASAQAVGDAERGEREFRRCLACHSAEPGVHKTGPSLAGIWGRAAGTVAGFGRYSPALKDAKLVWDAETLDRWLGDPEGLIPGNRMTLGKLRNARARQDIIAYLQSLAAPAAGAAGAERAPPPNLPDLKQLDPDVEVRAIRYCADSYFVTTAAGETHPIWEFNLRFKTDSSAIGPAKGRPALLRAGMQGDRAFLIFADPAEISAFIEAKC